MRGETAEERAGLTRRAVHAGIGTDTVTCDAWLWASAAVASGYVSCLKLISLVGIEALWTASARELREWGLRTRTALALVAHRDSFNSDAVTKQLTNTSVHFIPPSHRSFPSPLKDLADPPAGLYLKGELGLWDDAMGMARVTIVGTRAASRYGFGVAGALGRSFATVGCVVVSGLARGIDAAAHRGALEVGGLTVAVLGTGPDVVYPRQHASLYREVEQRGVLVSEYPPGTSAAKWHFPARNRLMAALGDALIVVEAGRRSGALLTADEALTLGRDVFAVPGPISSPASRGCNALAADGARIVYDVEQCVKEYEALTRIERSGRAVKTPCAKAERRGGPAGVLERLVVQALSCGPRSVDEVAQAVGCAPREVAAALALLELDGLVGREGVGVYVLSP